jgi:hypothetical protein
LSHALKSASRPEAKDAAPHVADSEAGRASVNARAGGAAAAGPGRGSSGREAAVAAPCLHVPHALASGAIDLRPGQQARPPTQQAPKGALSSAARRFQRWLC